MKHRLLMSGRLLALAASALLFDAALAGGPRVPPSAQPADRQTQHPARGYETVGWDALLPEDWNPNKLLEEMKLEDLQDGDPRAKEVMGKIRQMWNAAPVNRKVNQRRIRISGFVVPLEGDRNGVREFLLVPYFGACLHLPPPPANQIIHVTLPSATKGIDPTSAAWVSGTLSIDRGETRMATAAYKMAADHVETFKREWTPF